MRAVPTPELASVDLGEPRGQGLRAFARSPSFSTGNPADFVGTPSDPQFAWSYRHQRTVRLSLIVALTLAACAGPPIAPARPFRAGSTDHGTGVFRGAGGIELVEQWWRPARTPRAVLVIHHGLKSHGSHYAELAGRLVARGYAVHAYDMRGHGRSAGRRAALDDFDDLLADLDLFLARVRRREPGRPIYLAGHSVGGAVVTLYVLSRRRSLAGLILLAPALRVDRPPIAAAATPMAAALFPNLPAVDVPDEQFSRSPAVRREMAADPLIYHRPGPVRTAAALTAALARIWARADEIDLPLLGMHGTADRATSPRGSAELVRRARSPDKTLLLYRGLYHDLVREPERDQVMTDIERWLDRRSPP
jgi:acylglycerol lipase